jgi:hypothetical protein
MEASKKPQLPLDHESDRAPVVRPLEDRLVIEKLEVVDELAARVVRDQAAQKRPPAETVRKAIEIGTRVIDSESVATNVDLVKRELESGLGDLNRRLESTLEDGGTSLAEKIAETFGEDRSGSVQQQIKAIVAEATEQQRIGLLKLLSAEDGSNPLVAVQARMGKAVLEAEERHRTEMARLREGHANEARAVQNEVAGLRENLARLLEKQQAEERLAEAEEAGTRKGRSFEEKVHEVIDEIAGAREDVAHHVGDLPGETRGKKGDTVVEIGAALGPCLAKIAFDPKDTSNLTRPKAWEVLNGSLDDRGADYAVLAVATEDNLPAGTQNLVEYEGNKLIVAVDREAPERIVLETAYGLARARALAGRKEDLALDAPAMKEAIEEARRALEALKTARQALTGVRKNADSIESALARMEETAKAALARADSLIADALEGAS